MTMTGSETYQGWIGSSVIDVNGEKLGKVAQIYVDDSTGQPAWMTVHTGLFGGKTFFVPLHGASAQGDTLAVAYSKEQVKGAPQIDEDGALTTDEEQQLYSYYDQSYSNYTGPDTSGTAYGASSTGYDTSGPATDNAMTRSEERLVVGKAREEVGRARLRKYIVTENVQTTVPVSHEEVRIEREPITDANRDQAMAGPDISEEEHEVVLTAERPVVQKEVVPVERVRLTKETATEETVVNDQVRKEQIDTEGVEQYREP